MKTRLFLISLLAVYILGSSSHSIDAASRKVTGFSPSPVIITGVTEATPSATLTPEPTAIPRGDLTQKSEQVLGPLEQALKDQVLGEIFPQNPFKYAIRNAVTAGVPANTIVLLLLLPGVAAFIAAARHLIGLRGFGIFLPAALSIVFIATGPFVGLGLFLVIVIVSTFVRMGLRKFKVKLQYLPRMALLLLAVVLGVLGLLFLTPLIPWSGLTHVSIFPVLFLVLLAEDFSRVQLGKSVRIAVNLTTETLILAFISYIFLTTQKIQFFALLHPEVYLLIIVVFDYLVGKYVGLRFLEYWRFRKLIKS